MIYLDLLYFYSLLRKQHVKCGPPADRLDYSISTKMASQPCGGTIANKPTHSPGSRRCEEHRLDPGLADTVRAFTAKSIHFLVFHQGKMSMNQINSILKLFKSEYNFYSDKIQKN